MATRYLTKFESADGLTQYTFPLTTYEAEFRQPLRTPRAYAAGVDYAVRLIGSSPALKDVGSARVRFKLRGTASEVDQARDEMATKLQAIGLGKLWTSDNRWAWASLVDMPEISLSFRSPESVPVALGFDVWSDFFQDPAITVSEVVTASGQQWVVNNGGPLAVAQMVITLTPQTATGLTIFDLANLTNGYFFSSLRESVATTDRLRLVTTYQDGPAVEYSDDSGATWENDFANYVAPPSDQPILSFRLEPGANTLQLDALSPNVQVQIVFNEVYP